MALIAAIVLVLAASVVTAIVVDAIHGRSNPIIANVSGDKTADNVVEAARAAGYKEGARDANLKAKEQISARYDQGYAKGYAQGREKATTGQGQDGGYQDGFNAGIKATEEAYKKIIEQAQQIIAAAKARIELGQAP